jgi:tetratricopeptide (TPR) repeat protein
VKLAAVTNARKQSELRTGLWECLVGLPVTGIALCPPRCRLAIATLLALPLLLAAQKSPAPSPSPSKDDSGANAGFAFSPPGPAKSVEIGNYYLRRKDYKGALSRFEEAARTNPNYAPAYLGLGKVYEKTGARQKALDAYQEYLDLLPSDKDAEDAKEVHRAIDRLHKSATSAG